jgi:LmbE family N-acetylglucosaminyl deacetylase
MKPRRIILWLVVLFMVVAAAIAAYLVLAPRGSAPGLSDLHPLQLDGYQRILILAPHCDDESLGSAGLIQEALRKNIEVLVVIATNGDGFLFATMEDFRRLYPSHADFIRMGNLRQQESLAAMQVIGLRSGQVTFLSYPDRGTPALWNDHWSAQSPYRSPYIGDNKSPYAITYNPKSVYAGEDYLADLQSILASYRPDLIIYPHPDDVHPDHWGLSAFTRLAVALLEKADPSYHPNMYAYLVHRPDFPIPEGLLPNDSLLPPALLYDIYPDWWRLDLSQDDTAIKEQAVLQYKSQLPLLRKLLESFIRKNELFAQPQPATLADLSSGDAHDPAAWRDASGLAIPPIQKDPTQDFFTRNAVTAADLVAAYAAQTPENSLVICGQVRDSADSPLSYTLRILAVGSQGVVHRTYKNHSGQSGYHATLSGPYFCSSEGLSDLGDPWLIFVGADVEEVGVGILDQIAWQQVDVELGPGSGK